MFRKFYPSLYVKSAYSINYQKLYDKGIRGLIFDVDNTLVPHGAAATDNAKELFKNIRNTGIRTCIISNNKESRVRPFAEETGSLYISNAHKPGISGYKRAMELMGTSKDSTYFIGDQIFTDIYGANRAGIPSILVRPISKKEEIQIVFKRKLEKIVLYFYKRSKK